MRLIIIILFIWTNSLANSFEYNGLKRTYFLHIPDCYNSNNTVPLVVALHGGGGTAKSMIRFTKFDELSEKENFIVLYPQGFKRQWNDGRNSESIPAQKLRIDDVGFINALIDHICNHYNVDESRIYVTGASNGGFMSTRLGCELSHKLAAIAPIISTFPADLKDKCTPKNPLPMMLINGTDDPLVPYNGGIVKVGKKNRGQILSTNETIMYWVKQNKCATKAKIITIDDKDKNDNSFAIMEVYTDGENNSEVILVSVKGGGHAIPGGKQYLPKSIIGIVCHDFIAEEFIWNFFKNHTKKI